MLLVLWTAATEASSLLFSWPEFTFTTTVWVQLAAAVCWLLAEWCVCVCEGGGEQKQHKIHRECEPYKIMRPVAFVVGVRVSVVAVATVVIVAAAAVTAGFWILVDVE